MKTVVSVNEISEFEIKPQAELAAWRSQVEEEIARRWKSPQVWNEVPCPVCMSAAAGAAFERNGFSYAECGQCGTLFARTRPSNSELNEWYTQSQSVKYWHETMLASSAASRNEKIIEPRALWIADGLSEYLPQRKSETLIYTDVSFFGTQLVDKIKEIVPGIDAREHGIGPGKNSSSYEAVSTLAGIGETDVLVAIDVLERIESIAQWLEEAAKKVKAGGLVFATCPVSSGFEIQSLWERSPSVIPPDKLNLPSVNALISLVSRLDGWTIRELSTPGMFDVQVVKKTMTQYDSATWPRSLHALMDNITVQGAEQFTEYLQSQRLCSFARIVLQKK